MVTKDDPRIQYGDSFGSIDPNDKFFDDNKALKYESLNPKDKWYPDLTKSTTSTTDDIISN